ncbi:MAG: hypothetical protein H6822_15035 [Planctomycetaceae bacterium]|nr:hypothetical protein [Planctomycetales bacterium]MCB9923495.1 hypothetical protein [Planctomycetaceae bacterium]
MRFLINLMAGMTVMSFMGCDSPRSEPTVVAVTASKVRAERRAYDGAPPTIPHPPLGATCTACHTKTGSSRPGVGFAPANPHIGTPAEGAVQNCNQCHVFKNPVALVVASNFAGRPQDLRLGSRLYRGAPPVMPHAKFMRENCNACHRGDAARPEIRCSHPERSNCMQCHLERELETAALR